MTMNPDQHDFYAWRGWKAVIVAPLDARDLTRCLVSARDMGLAVDALYRFASIPTSPAAASPRKYLETPHRPDPQSGDRLSAGSEPRGVFR